MCRLARHNAEALASVVYPMVEPQIVRQKMDGECAAHHAHSDIPSIDAIHVKNTFEAAHGGWWTKRAVENSSGTSMESMDNDANRHHKLLNLFQAETGTTMDETMDSRFEVAA